MRGDFCLLTYCEFFNQGRGGIVQGIAAALFQHTFVEAFATDFILVWGNIILAVRLVVEA